MQKKQSFCVKICVCQFFLLSLRPKLRKDAHMCPSCAKIKNYKNRFTRRRLRLPNIGREYLQTQVNG